MPEIGQLSGSLEEKEQGFKPRSRRYAGPDWGWQTEESYNKIVQQRNRGLGSEAVDFIEEKAGQTFGFISQIPGVKQGLEFVGGIAKFVDRTAIQPAIQAAEDPSRAGTPEALIGTVFKAGQMAEQGGAQIARNLGVDPRIGSAVAGAAYETVTGAAVGKLGRVADTLTPPGGGMTPALAAAGGPQLTMRGGSVNLQPPTVNKLTVTERIAEGVTQGIANTPQFADQLKRMDIRWAQSEKRLKRWVENTSDPTRRARNIKKSRDALKGKASTGPARVEDIADENWYTKDNKDFVDVINQAPQLGLERHHMFPKAESYIFVEHMRSLIRQGIADRDDMVNLFLYAEDAGAVMGNRKANMLLMEKRTQHGPHHRMREQTAGALGLVMEPDNLQDLADVVKTATNADELMDLFDEYLIKNIKPSKRDAFERVMGPSKQVLAKTLEQKRLQSTLSESQRRRL